MQCLTSPVDCNEDKSFDFDGNHYLFELEYTYEGLNQMKEERR